MLEHAIGARSILVNTNGNNLRRAAEKMLCSNERSPNPNLIPSMPAMKLLFALVNASASTG